jgi:Family of unknown function (DUF5335)
MKFVTHEVPRGRWTPYLGEITESIPPADVSIETVTAGGGPAARGGRLTLQGLVYNRRDDLFVVLMLRGTAEGARTERHLIRHPVRIRTDAPDELLPTTIVVDAADGSCTVVRIEPVPAFTG